MEGKMNKKTIIIICACAAVAAVLYFGLREKKSTSETRPPASPTASAEISEEVSPSASVEKGEGKAVSTEQLSSFKTLLNDAGNYGFLLSEYSDVRSADLSQIFYNGAGTAPAADAQSIVNAYKAAMTDEAPDTDCIVLKTAQINDFLKEKTGYALKDMKSKLDWEYDAQNDAYLFFHGDTNQVRIIPVSGRSLGGDRYELTCTFDGAFYDPNGGETAGCIVTFTYKNGKPVFLSNQFTR